MMIGDYTRFINMQRNNKEMDLNGINVVDRLNRSAPSNSWLLHNYTPKSLNPKIYDLLKSGDWRGTPQQIKHNM